MDGLIKENWNMDKLEDFYEILNSYKHEDRIEWEKRVVNTNYDVLSVSAPDLKKIAKTIYKGNYVSFLDLMPSKYIDSLIICAYLISFIKDFDQQKKYIDKISKYIDNWSVVDSLKFYTKNHEQDYLDYSKELINSSEPFTRRIGVRILFSYTKNDDYVDQVFSILKTFDNEKHYYVNMACAWLLCELFIYQPEKTFKYLENNRSNSFIINKAISKCRDSYRVSKEDKEKLLKLKIK